MVESKLLFLLLFVRRPKELFCNSTSDNFNIKFEFYSLFKFFSFFTSSVLLFFFSLVIGLSIFFLVILFFSVHIPDLVSSEHEDKSVNNSKNVIILFT